MKTSTPTTATHSGTIDTSGLVSDARGDVGISFDRFRVMAGIDNLQTLMNEDTAMLAGERCGRDAGKPGYRGGRATGLVGFRGGRIRARRPRMRDRETGRELPLPGREEIRDVGFLEEWATSLMLMNVRAGKFRGAVRLPSRPAVWRRHRSTGRGEAPRMDVIGHPGGRPPGHPD